MPIASAIVGHVVFIRWPKVPQDEDIAAFDAVMAEARKVPGAPLHHVGFIQEGTELPAPPVQKALLRRVIKMQSQVESMHAILEGKGVMSAIGRRFLKGMVKMVRLRGASVHANAEEALKAMPDNGTLGLEKAAILERARALGLMGAP